MIYADNAATTKLDAEAFEAMKPYLLNEYGNASQPYAFSRIPRKALLEARRTIAECINAAPDEIYFTSGGTESDNWAIKGVSFAASEKKEIITTAIEHHAILNSCGELQQLGYPISYLEPTSKGTVESDRLKEKITSETGLVSIMFANNEIGTMQPIRELCSLAHSKDVLFHTDAVQAVGHVKIDVQELGVDMLSASAHKFNGPKGIGFLYIRKGTKIIPYANGGAQENGMRAGTENIASIVGMSIALKNNCTKLSESAKHVNDIENELISILKENNLDFIRNGENQTPGNISLSFKNWDGELILHRLDLMGVCISTGSACDGKSNRISHVLKAIHMPAEYATGTIRISLNKDNTMEEIKYIANCLVSLLSNKQ